MPQHLKYARNLSFQYCTWSLSSSFSFLVANYNPQHGHGENKRTIKRKNYDNTLFTLRARKHNLYGKLRVFVGINCTAHIYIVNVQANLLVLVVVVVVL